MKTPEEVRGFLLKKWQTGRYFFEGNYPLSAALGMPSAAVMTDKFSEVRRWASDWQKKESGGCPLEWKEINHRLLGKNRLPAAVVFHAPETLARYIGRLGELKTYASLRGVLHKADARLAAEWADTHPFDLIACGDDLPRLITLWRWMVFHPRPGLYLRQIDLPGIDTKFTARYRRVLTDWLDLTLPPEHIDETFIGVKHFEERYGFRKKPELIRFRILDPSLAKLWNGCSDISVPSEEFCQLYSRVSGSSRESACPFEKVFVVENDITALSFPELEKGLVIFGRGYSFSSWNEAAWLKVLDLYYWGDIDTHGFRILDEFRSFFPCARSILMDRQTLLDHEASWGEEKAPQSAELTRLTEEEGMLYDDLRFNRLRPYLRLEQEFIRMESVYGLLNDLSLS